jgi:hypothetical protein
VGNDATNNLINCCRSFASVQSTGVKAITFSASRFDLAQTILYSNPDDTFRGRSHGYLVGPYGVVAICEALDKAAFEIGPKQKAQPSGLGFLSFCCGCHETRYLKTVTL